MGLKVSLGWVSVVETVALNDNTAGCLEPHMDKGPGRENCQC